MTGHAISHSNCPWGLDFIYSSIDDDKFELFCQGCAAPEGTGCRGHISYAHFSINDLTSKSIQSFVNTVKPPNRGHFGDGPFVPCREVVLFSEVLF